ncbi:MAG: hypothetical protein UW04_C0020G0003 [Parcubacteria group bacterium GW2011_GWB1_43_8]|nr:MAG: hypothetical protein UW04_C0020G0003 [Parcubacteria group bacterium GW2011_GWB1_43_8]
MKNFTEEQIAQMYDNLPEDLKDAIFGLEMNEIVEKIGRENQLNIEQIGDLANETGMVMLGVTHPNEFIGNLADRLEVDKEKARAIAQEINEQIFKKVRDSIRKIHNMREEEERGGGARFSFSGKEGESYETGASSSFQKTQGETLKSEHSREDILKEIEKDHTQENLVPEIMKANANPFEEKMKEGVLIAPVEEKLLPEPEKPKKYQGFDPYKEPID